jgi:hypothetical protein
VSAARKRRTFDAAEPRDPACSSVLALRLAEHGLIVLGAFAPGAEDGVPPLSNGLAARTVTLVGNAGPGMWNAFQAARREEPHPLDSWTRRVIEPLAAEFGLEAAYPFSGPPFLPFHAWGLKAGAFFPSPLPTAIHPRYGTWFGLRAALLSPKTDPGLADPAPRPVNPCDGCADRPCLSACQSGAIGKHGYDARRCLDFLETLTGHACLMNGCHARHACPVGRDYAYGQAQAEFHMRAFVRNFGPLIRDA